MDYKTNKKNLLQEYKFSLCTACFNSSDTIQRLYDSIEDLNFEDFEWIVVNDASTDDTADKVLGFMEDAEFDIDFYNLDNNRMVTYCYNLLVRKSKGEFLILLDHDGMVKKNALSRFNYYIEDFSNKDFEKIAGVISNCEDENGDLVGTPFPESPFVEGFFEIIFDHGVRGEKFFCYKTEIMREFNFPLVDRYVPESTVIWNISSKYKTIFINESLRTYVQPPQGGNNLSFLDRLDYSKGFRFNYLELLNRHYERLIHRPYLTLTFISNYLFLSFNSKIFFLKILKDLNKRFFKILAGILSPLVFIYWAFLRSFHKKITDKDFV